MFRSGRAWLPLALVLAAGAPAPAGVYCLREQRVIPLPTSYTQMRQVLDELRTLPVRKEAAATPFLRTFYGFSYPELLARLEGSWRKGELGFLDHIDLGACYLRLGRPDDARRVLEEGLRQGADSRARFLLQANLAATYHALYETTGESRFLEQALSTQRGALESWPVLWAGWPGWQLHAAERAERAYLRLLELRHEQARVGGQAAAQPSLEPLFPRLRFVGPSGEYEAGTLAVAMWDSLPGDAPTTVWQLVLARPFDDRLYWLLGEVLNARGQVGEAYRILDELGWSRNVRVRELAQHRQVLAEAVAVLEAWDQNPGTSHFLLTALAPRGLPGSVGLAAAWQEVAPVVVAQAQAALAAADGSPTQGTQAPPAKAAPTRAYVGDDALPSWRSLGVGFGAGILVGLLGFWQVQQWRRRVGSGVMERRLEEG